MPYAFDTKPEANRAANVMRRRYPARAYKVDGYSWSYDRENGTYPTAWAVFEYLDGGAGRLTGAVWFGSPGLTSGEAPTD